MGKNLKGKELGKGFGQRKDGRYEARAVINGQKICLYDFDLKKLKVDFEREKKRIENSINPQLCTTVGEWFEIWFEKYKLPALKSTGVSAYKRKYINTYGRLLNDEVITDLNQYKIQTACSQLVNDGVSNKYNRDGLGALKSMLDAAVGTGIIEKNPALGVIVPAYEPVKEDRRVLTKNEQEYFIDFINGDYYEPMYLFMLSTGLRIGEVGALQWKDIDFDKELITVRNSLSCQYENGVKVMEIVTPKTRNSIRKVPFFGETKTILLNQKETQNELKNRLGKRWRTPEGMENIDFVFTTSVGSPITRFIAEERMKSISKDINQIMLYKAIEERTVPNKFEAIHPHALRHTFATRCLEKGMKIETLQRIMGHANINMTLSYAHILEDTIKEEARKVGNLLDA